MAVHWNGSSNLSQRLALSLTERLPYIFGAVTVAVDVIIGVQEGMNSMVIDGVLLTVCYLMSHAVILGFIIKAQQGLLKLRKEMTKEAKEQGLTLVDLAKAQEDEKL